MNTNLYNKNNCTNKQISNKLNLINSLQEVECFLNNLNCILTSAKIAKLIKKIK